LVAFTAYSQQGGFSDQRDQRGQDGQGGFRGPSADVSTVAQARTMRDDSPVILRGKIERSLGNEKYSFSDDTGTIIIDIDRRVWGTLTVDQNDTVEISGEIDRERNNVEVDVNSIRKL